MGKNPSQPTDYALLDSGDGQRFERFGPYRIARPCSQAVWKPSLPDWRPVDARFGRMGGWSGSLPEEWPLLIDGIRFSVRPTDFGHLGFFPEHTLHWPFLKAHIKPGMNVLNLFAYTGGITLLAAQAGAKVCHVDASKPSIEWAVENVSMNGLSSSPIRWIIDDALKFVKREERRGVQYDVVILDPPSFGRGAKGEVFKIEEAIHPLLSTCFHLNPKALLLTCHTGAFSPVVLNNLVEQIAPKGKVETGETVIGNLPLGTFARWHAHH